MVLNKRQQAKERGTAHDADNIARSDIFTHRRCRAMHFFCETLVFFFFFFFFYGFLELAYRFGEFQHIYDMHSCSAGLTFEVIINVTRWIIPSEWFVWIIPSESFGILLGYIVNRPVRSFSRSVDRSIGRSIGRLFVRTFVCLFVCSFVRSFIRLFVCLFVRLSVRLFIRSFVYLSKVSNYDSRCSSFIITRF